MAVSRGMLVAAGMLFLVVVLGWAGCAMLRRPYYSAAVINKSDEQLDKFQVQYGESTVKFGSVIPHDIDYYHGIPYRPPARAYVSWQTKDGTAHGQEVEVAKALPWSIDDWTLFFVIHKDGSVEFVPMAGKDRRRGKHYELLRAPE